MSEQLLDKARVDRTAFSVTTLAEAEQADLEYWRQRTPEERLEALELSRQITCPCYFVGNERRRTRH